MSKSVKALLLSALVSPGAGHLYLKQRGRAAALFVTIFIALWVIISNALDLAEKIKLQMQAQNVTVDMDRILDISTQAAQNFDSTSSTLALYLLLACWIFGIIDSYRLGKIEDAMLEE
jgi:uncharacterized membrane protein HdeD (DUF308 family)